MIILPILTASLIPFFLKGWEDVHFWTWVKLPIMLSSPYVCYQIVSGLTSPPEVALDAIQTSLEVSYTHHAERYSGHIVVGPEQGERGEAKTDNRGLLLELGRRGAEYGTGKGLSKRESRIEPGF